MLNNRSFFTAPDSMFSSFFSDYHTPDLHPDIIEIKSTMSEYLFTIKSQLCENEIARNIKDNVLTFTGQHKKTDRSGEENLKIKINNNGENAKLTIQYASSDNTKSSKTSISESKNMMLDGQVDLSQFTLNFGSGVVVLRAAKPVYETIHLLRIGK